MGTEESDQKAVAHHLSFALKRVNTQYTENLITARKWPHTSGRVWCATFLVTTRHLHLTQWTEVSCTCVELLRVQLIFYLVLFVARCLSAHNEGVQFTCRVVFMLTFSALTWCIAKNPCKSKNVDNSWLVAELRLQYFLFCFEWQVVFITSFYFITLLRPANIEL